MQVDDDSAVAAGGMAVQHHESVQADQATAAAGDSLVDSMRKQIAELQAKLAQISERSMTVAAANWCCCWW